MGRLGATVAWFGLAWSGAVAAPAAVPATDAHEACGREGIAVQVLGSGGPELEDRRASSGYLVWRNGTARLLIDIGGGAALRFGQSGATMTGLDAILLTHLHVDHAGDLPALVMSSFFEDRRATLPLFGPAGNAGFPSTTRFVASLFRAPNGAFRYLDDFVRPAARGPYLLEAHAPVLGPHELRPLFDHAGIKVTAATVIHGAVPALAYRVEIDGIRMVFAGDGNGDNGNLELLASGAQVLVAPNAIPEGATGVERALHMPPSVIGRIARDAAVERLVVSHRMLRTLGQETDTEAHIRDSYRGPINFANDLDCFPLRKPAP